MEKIITEFKKLTASEQQNLLKTLNSLSTTAADINEFSQRHQQKFGSNIEFSQAVKAGPDHAPTITIHCTTAFGTFQGSGPNQKVAKLAAIEEADSHWVHRGSQN